MQMRWRWLLTLVVAVSGVRASSAQLLFADYFAYGRSDRSLHWLWRLDSPNSEHIYGERGTAGPQLGFKVTVPPSYAQQCSVTQQCPVDETCREGYCVRYQNAEVYPSPCYQKAVAKLPEGQALFRDLLWQECEQANIWNSGDDFVNLAQNPVIIDPIGSKQFYLDLYLNQPWSPGTHFSWWAKAENLQQGSRGWGLWNTNISVGQQAYAWFIQFDGLNEDGTPYVFNGTWVMIQAPGQLLPKAVKINDLDEGWHSYEIVWTKSAMAFYVDSMLVHLETELPIQVPMGFHNWVDNAVFGFNGPMGGVGHICQKLTASRANYMARYEVWALGSEFDVGAPVVGQMVTDKPSLKQRVGAALKGALGSLVNPTGVLEAAESYHASRAASRRI